MAFLCPLLLWGEGEESPQLSRPSSAAPKLYTGHRGHPATKSPLPLPPWLLLWRRELVHPGQPRPCLLLLGCSPPAAASEEEQPPFSPSPSLSPPSALSLPGASSQSS